MPQFDPNKYEDVKTRLEKFWAECPNGRVLTRLLSNPDNLEEVVVQAEVYADREDTRPVSTGLAFEKRGTNFKDGANFTSHLENCETSAIGRAFANWIFKASKDSPRPSRQEIEKVNRANAESQAEPDPSEYDRDAEWAALINTPGWIPNPNDLPACREFLSQLLGRPVEKLSKCSGLDFATGRGALERKKAA